MSYPFDFYISIEDVLSDFSKVDTILKKCKEAIIINENKPKYVVMSVERFEELTRAVEILEEIEEKKMLPKLLNAVGKRCFVEYYHELLQNYESKTSIVDFLPYEFTLASKRVRVSNAKKIFKKGWEIDALQIIIDSNRVDSDIAEKAKMILSQLIK